MGTCPDCGFKGNELHPQGYAGENHILTKTIHNKKSKRDEVVRDLDDNGKEQFKKIMRCPLCGYVEGKPLQSQQGKKQTQEASA